MKKCLLLGLIGLMSPISPIFAQTNTAGSQKPAPLDDVYDIRPPYFFLQSWTWLWITLAAIVALAVVAALCYWLWPGQRQLSPKSAYDLALENLEKARGLIREDVPMPYAVMVSETVRSYLSQRFQTPSTRRTTEEFLRLMQADPAATLADHRDLLREFLQSCDMVKFARYQPTFTELEQVQDRAVSFVTATKPKPVTVSPAGVS